MALTMERESKKRRFNLNDIDTNSDNDIDHDDVKMEKFFALIRSANDIRGQLMGPIQTTATTTTMTKDRKLETAVVWQPSFRPEDFGGGGGVIHTDNLTVVKNDVHGSSKGSKQDGDNKAADQSNTNVQGGGNAILLDLNLSL